jgi:hypothetical protein
VNCGNFYKLADIIGDVENKCDDALRHLNWDFTSFLADLPGMSPRRVRDVEEAYKKVIKKYREKLDLAQQVVKKTEAAMRQVEKALLGKTGEFGLDLLGYYDVQRIFSEYDPITGEKLTFGDRLLATGMTVLSVLPPAKGVGMAGKTSVKGINAATKSTKFSFSIFAKTPDVLKSIRNVLSTQKVLEVFKGIYKEVILGPLADTKLLIDKTVKKIADMPLTVKVAETTTGDLFFVPNKTVGQMFSDAKDSFVKVVKGDNLERTHSNNIIIKNFDEVPRIKEITLEFKYKTKFDEGEFARQLADQEVGMNQLTVDEYLRNRERYINEGRAIESNAVQQAARKEALAQRIAELRKEGLSYSEAKKLAQEWLNSQAALHNPDQVAGGNPLKIGGIGDKVINSSIGSQWKYMIDIVDEHILALAAKMSDSEKQSTYLNVKLTYRR